MSSMIISKIIREDNVYYSLHAEQTVTGTFLDEPGSGILEEILTLTTIDNVIKDVRDFNYLGLNVVLNFEDIISCQNNIKKKIIELIDLSKVTVLINIKKEIVEDLEVGIFKNPNNVETSEIYNVFFLSSDAKLDVRFDIITLFEEEFLSKLKGHLDKGIDISIYHHSSSVYLTTYINIKSFVSRERGFFIYSVYFLAMRMKKHWSEIVQTSDFERPILVCQNLNSSYISSLLSSFLKLDILILDQIGPINKLYKTLDRKIEEDKNYIVVSDLVCLGTEIKITKSLIEFLGGKYIGNVSIIRIETLLPEHKEYVDTECVCTITKENNNEIGYQIKTALNLD